MNAGLGEPAGDSVPPVTLVAWFALCAAYLELAYMGGSKLYQHLIFAGPHIVWMTPLGYLILFAPLVIVIAVIRRAVPSAHQFRISMFLLTGILAFSVLSMFWVKLGPVSTLLLTAGVATQLTRTISARPSGFARMVRRTLPAMLALGLMAGVGLNAWRWYREYSALRSLRGDRSAPNVILLVLDTVREMSLSLYGYPRQTTPGLERLSARGVVFEEAYSTAPWTLPSIATIFTGRYPHEHGASWRTPLSGRDRTLAEAFRDAGYITGGFVANQTYSSGETGLGRGFIRYEDYETNILDILASAAPGRFILNNPQFREAIESYDTFDRKTADRLNAAFLSWLRANEQRPFFAYLNYYDAHEPYLPPSPFDTLFGPDSIRNKSLILHVATRDAFRRNKEDMTEVERAAEQRAYDGAIAYLDSRLEMLMAELDRQDTGRETIVIITADHGELFGEHGLFTHGNSLYLPLVRVPLLVVAPSLPRGVRIATPVTLRDLPRTILELAGLPAGTIPGASLAGLARGAGAPAGGSPLIASIEPSGGTRETDPVFKGPMWTVFASPFQYIVGGDGKEELYEYARDPEQLINLAADPVARPVLDRLRAAVDSVRRK